MSMKKHWEHIYETKDLTQVSWYQEHAQYSLKFIQDPGVQKSDPIIDIVGNASVSNFYKLSWHSDGLTLLVYEPVRRWNVTRRLFGMKPARKDMLVSSTAIARQKI